jgi:hypothetical protein
MKFPIHGMIGAFIIAGAGFGAVLPIPFVRTYLTPIFWTGYILLTDGILLKRYGESLIASRPKAFALMLPWSILCWLIFEVYNIRLQNWTYVGLPGNLAERAAGYVWSFATIFPAIFLTAELVRRRPKTESRAQHRRLSGFGLAASMTIGCTMLLIPAMLMSETSGKLFALVWLGFIFMLDPVNYLRGGRSVIRDVSEGELSTLISLLVSGFVCGFLWEFWNSWASARWIYTVPLEFVGPKIFEMPLLGYLGFLPFAVECYVMNEFMYSLFPNLKPRLA